MADASAPARSTTITPEQFRDIAESAGKELEGRLQEDQDSGKRTLGVVSFEIKKYEGVLKEVMTAFEKEVGHISFVLDKSDIA
jgi:hypothetical protein